MNPFFVNKTVYSDSMVLADGINFAEAVVSTSFGQWRDTVFIPPNGFTQILQRFAGGEKAWTGKTVFHCHFLDHEDQGMIAAIMIADPNHTVSDDDPPLESPTSSPSPSPAGPALMSQEPTDVSAGWYSSQVSMRATAGVLLVFTALLNIV